MPFLIPALLFNPHGISVALLSDPTVSWLASPLALVISVDKAARICADHKPSSYKGSTYAHSHKLHIDTVCLCCNVLDPCHGFTFSFTFPLSTTTQLFFRCYAALRQAQGRHRGRQFGAHARGNMARSLPSQSFTSLPLLLEYSLPYWACPQCEHLSVQ